MSESKTKKQFVFSCQVSRLHRLEIVVKIMSHRENLMLGKVKNLFENWLLAKK